MDSKDRIREIDWSLYVIIDNEWLKGRLIQEIAYDIVRGGAGVIQYRNKVSESRVFYEEALTLRVVTAENGIPLIINDRVDMALAVDADGVHLGRDDLPVDIARRIVGEEMILGASVHSLSEFEKMKNGDYFGVGAVSPTKTKEKAQIGGVDIIRKVRVRTHLPIVGIGGITLDNLVPVVRAGADGVAVISAIMGADDVETATKRFVDGVKRAKSMEVLKNDGLS